MTKLRLLSLFSGIGAFEKALSNIGVDYELVNYCEIDKHASKAFSLIHGVDESLNLGDISKVTAESLPEADLMTYGFPCQDISALGNMSGLTNDEGKLTRSGLFFEAMRIAKEKRPKYMVAENVKMLVSKKFKDSLDDMVKLLDELGYETNYRVLNSKDYGVPQSRGRVFIISIRKDISQEFNFPEPTELKKKASDYYDGYVTDDHYISEAQMKYLSEFRLKKKYSSLNADIINCQTTKQGNLSNAQNFIQDKKGIRIMTSRELLALQGFDKSDADILLANGITKEQIGKMSGNSITVDVLEAIFRNLLTDQIGSGQ
jgi:DNA-cytosine methyltransferase